MNATRLPGDDASRPLAPPCQGRKRRVVIERRVTSAEYERHKEKMEALGLDASDPVPAGELLTVGDGAQVDVVASFQAGTVAPATNGNNTSFSAVAGASGEAIGTSAAMTGSSRRISQRRTEQKKVSLQKRTICEQVEAGRHSRALNKFHDLQCKWESFSKHAATSTRRAREQLVMNRAEEHRERLEVMELLDRATPEEVKSGGHSWYHSLRGEGTRFIQIGNMFSGLYLPVKMHKEEYVHEIVRKPLMRELVNSRFDENGERKGPRTWRDDEYLLQRIRRYRQKMEDLAPGRLEQSEILEPEVVPLRPVPDNGGTGITSSSIIRDSQEEAGAGEDDQMGDCRDPTSEGCDTGEMQALLKGPHFEAHPDRLQFKGGVRELCTRSICLKNKGTATITYEWVPDHPSRNYQESILPDDPTYRFTCKQARGRVLPGRDSTTCFTFISSTPGVYTTSWSLKTSPELFNFSVSVVMHGVATELDLLQESRENFQSAMREEQVLHQVQELVEDMVADSIKLQRPRLPDFQDIRVQGRFFEDCNTPLGLYYTQHAWQEFHALRDRIDAMKPAAPAASGAQASTQVKAVMTPSMSVAPRDRRGRQPYKKPPPEIFVNPMSRIPNARQMQDQLASVPGSTSLSTETGKARLELAVDLNKAIRAAKNQPLERSPIWWAAFETVSAIAASIPEIVETSRGTYGLAHWPFLPPLNDDASPEEETAQNEKVEERNATRGEDDKESEWREQVLFQVGNEGFGPRIDQFSRVAAEATILSRLRMSAAVPLRERFQKYLDRQSVESVEMGGSVVIYEVDLGFMGPRVNACLAGLRGATSDAEKEASETSLRNLLALEDGDDREFAKQRLQGVLSLLESSPLAILVIAHLGRPMPDAEEEQAPHVDSAVEEADEIPVAQTPEDNHVRDPVLARICRRMRGLPSMEPLLDLLKEVVEGPASTVEYVPHDAWLGEAQAFAEKVRSDNENKVFLMENFSAIPEEVGSYKVAVAQPVPVDDGAAAPPDIAANVAPSINFYRVPWAIRETWAQAAFSYILPDIIVQDSFAASSCGMTLHTGLWAAAPPRHIGPYIEAELSAFLDVLQLPFQRGGDAGGTGDTAEAAPTQIAAADAPDVGGARVPAPLLVAVGGGGFQGENGEDVLLNKLELLIGLSRLARHETDGVVLAIGGELAVAVLACVLQVSIGNVGAYASQSSTRNAVIETILEVFREGEISVQVPVDVVCQEIRKVEEVEAPPVEEDPKAKKKGGKAAAPRQSVPAPVPTEAMPLTEKCFDLKRPLALAAQVPISLGFSGGSECFLRVDPNHGFLSVVRGEAPVPPEVPETPETVCAAPEDPEANSPDPGEKQTDTADAPEIAKEGVPDGWIVCDIGSQTIDCWQASLRRSRGVVWNGALGKFEEEHFQSGTRSFLSSIEARLSGEEEEDEEDAAAGVNEEEEVEDEEGDEEVGSDDEEAKSKDEPEEVDFEVAVVIGRDSRTMLPQLVANPALISFVSQSGEGLVQLLRGAPLPGLLACVEKN